MSLANELANCMTLLLDSVEPSAMESLLLTDQIKYTKQLEEIQTGIQGTIIIIIIIMIIL